MRFASIGNDTDFALGAKYAVSALSIDREADVARSILRESGYQDDVFSWGRERREYGMKFRERLFANADDTKEGAERLFQALRERMDVLLCAKGEKPAVHTETPTPEGSIPVEYFSKYRELLPWRFRISCLMEYSRDTRLMRITTQDDKHSGSIDVSFVQYSPARDEAVLTGVGKNSFSSKGKACPKSRFDKRCLVQPEDMWVPGESKHKPFDMLRREIRAAVESLESDALVLNALSGR